MKELNHCPKCGTSLIGAPIPPEVGLKFYGGATHFRRDIGVEVPGLYDGVAYWECPDCSHSWHRFPEGSPIRARLSKIIPTLT